MQDNDYWNRTIIAWPDAVGTARPGRESESDDFIRELKGRSPSAWAVVYERHYSGIFGYAAARLDSVEEAEDVVAYTFQRALSNIGSYVPRGKPLVAWLFGITRNILREERRRAGRFLPSSVRDVYGQIIGRPAPAGGPDGNISRDAGTVDERIDLRDAIALLTPDQRDIIILRYVQGLSARETARTLGKPETAVYALQARAIAALRRELGGQFR